MLLKTAANYNDEGGYIEAWKNSDGTTEVKLIPKSGGDKEKQGLKSVTISPEITTKPALDSLFPIYWEDLTEEQKQSGKINYVILTDAFPQSEYSITFTPTTDWYLADVHTKEFCEKGEPFTVTVPVNVEEEKFLSTSVFASNGNTRETSTEYFEFVLTISTHQ